MVGPTRITQARWAAAASGQVHFGSAYSRNSLASHSMTARLLTSGVQGAAFQSLLGQSVDEVALLLVGGDVDQH